MKSKVIKDSYFRKFVKIEKKLLKKKYGTFQGFSNFFIKKNCSVSSIRNHCVFSNRSKAIFKIFKCSRIFLRAFILNGQVCGMVKLFFLLLWWNFGRHGRFKIYCFESLLVQIQLEVFF